MYNLETCVSKQVVYTDSSLASATYWSFSIGSEASNYKLNVSGYDGKVGGDGLDKNAGYSTWVSNGQQFTTYDRDNDQWLSSSCANEFACGWWYNHCSSSVLNRDVGHWILLSRVSYSRMAISRI